MVIILLSGLELQTDHRENTQVMNSILQSLFPNIHLCVKKKYGPLWKNGSWYHEPKLDQPVMVLLQKLLMVNITMEKVHKDNKLMSCITTPCLSVVTARE